MAGSDFGIYAFRMIRLEPRRKPRRGLAPEGFLQIFTRFSILVCMWTFGIRMIRLRPRRKPRRGICRTDFRGDALALSCQRHCKSCTREPPPYPGFPFHAIRMIRLKPRRKPRRKSSSKLGFACLSHFLAVGGMGLGLMSFFTILTAFHPKV